MNSERMVLIAGPCVIEDAALTLEIAKELKLQLSGLDVDFYFKASFDKANRSSIDGFRGPGMKDGLKILENVRSQLGTKIITDVHTPDQAAPVGEVVDFLQIPAFLCRQTDMIVSCAEVAGKKKLRLNVKKGQFLAPADAKNIVEKVRAVEKRDSTQVDLFLTERGASFGYNQLIVDMTSFETFHQFGARSIYDATHSVQVPGAGPGGKSTGGKREWIEPLARAAFAAGADSLFLECHPKPSEAKSDGPNAFYLDRVGAFVKQVLEFRKLAASNPYLVRGKAE